MLLAGPSTLKVGEQVEFRLTTAKGARRLRVWARLCAPISRADGDLLRRDRRGRAPPFGALHLRLPARRTAPGPGEWWWSWPVRTTSQAKPAKAGKAKKGKKERAPRAQAEASGSGLILAEHPRATRGVARAKAWGGLAGFLIGGYLSLPTQTLAGAGLRALAAGMVCYVADVGRRRVPVAAHAGRRAASGQARSARRRARQVRAHPRTRGQWACRRAHLLAVTTSGAHDGSHPTDRTPPSLDRRAGG